MRLRPRFLPARTAFSLASLRLTVSSAQIRWGAFYDVTTVSPGIAAQRPLVLDPGCPHNNVGNLLDKDAWRVRLCCMFSRAATTTDSPSCAARLARG